MIRPVVKKPSVLEQFAFSNSTLFNQINKGLMPPGIHLGDRAVGYLQHELDAVLSARIAGCSNEEIKLLVKNLIEERQADFKKTGGTL
ncbi:phage transcriptional regulator, AlpA [Psychromonas ingrahamii 37]|uniref:Phage transcriptional regulator, AlpA n=1 Tax=Psychromonas ingrahamii (strain DSM 17664 / CCUG 51855 / 37) TaxID=357804 RepID=A1SXJ6_PSYIN|nr:AlpA family phage regulatory protein [Psychromonas ingrahamii]ABM04211.1 phage transcriptional regulator, AlpA [Psychromonas ingrahamii 37]